MLHTSLKTLNISAIMQSGTSRGLLCLIYISYINCFQLHGSQTHESHLLLEGVCALVEKVKMSVYKNVNRSSRALPWSPRRRALLHADTACWLFFQINLFIVQSIKYQKTLSESSLRGPGDVFRLFCLTNNRKPKFIQLTEKSSEFSPWRSWNQQVFAVYAR